MDKLKLDIEELINKQRKGTLLELLKACIENTDKLAADRTITTFKDITIKVTTGADTRSFSKAKQFIHKYREDRSYFFKEFYVEVGYIGKVDYIDSATLRGLLYYNVEKIGVDGEYEITLRDEEKYAKEYDLFDDFTV